MRIVLEVREAWQIVDERYAAKPAQPQVQTEARNMYAVAAPEAHVGFSCSC
jgi:hypothetical protein